MNWQEVCEDPTLQDLPYKIELNRLGQIVMSPASNEHGRLQTRIAARLLSLMEGGEVITECSIDTDDGTKVAEVAWGSTDFFAEHGLVTPLPQSPQICVEILSPSNTDEEIKCKVALYLEAGAEEVWLCNDLGNMEFRDGSGSISPSRLAPEFPDRI